MSADAKPLTTAEALLLGEAFDGDGPLVGSVVVDRDELLATTRALEAAERDAVRFLIGRDDALVAAKSAERERDAARLELGELALEVGYGDRPEGQGGIHHPDGKTLAGAWLLERKMLANTEADRDAARATVAELVAALNVMLSTPAGTSDERCRALALAEGALARAKRGG